MKHFFIELDKPSQSYFSGEVVQGRVIIQTESSKEVKGITLLLEGVGRVQWSIAETFTINDDKIVDGRTNNIPKNSNRIVAYSENEKYISEKIFLAGDNYNPMTLPEGTSSFPFQFVLPPNCPSSFTTRFGHVSYILEAELRRHVLKRNKRTSLSFTVNGRVDLNTEPGAREPQQMQKCKISNLLACRTGHLRFVLKLNKSGFVPGEILDFSSDITNNSNRKINKVKASLQQVVQFQAKMITKVERRVICTIVGPEVHTGENQVWKPESIQIPPLPPTRLGGMCRIIDVQYLLRFDANIKGLSKGLSGELPVMIGTTALKNDDFEINNHSKLQNQLSKNSPRQSISSREDPNA